MKSSYQIAEQELPFSRDYIRVSHQDGFAEVQSAEWDGNAAHYRLTTVRLNPIEVEHLVKELMHTLGLIRLKTLHNFAEGNGP